jgi:S-phase kinase-associated protein 1
MLCPKRSVVLISSDGERIEVDERTACMSTVIRDLLVSRGDAASDDNVDSGVTDIPIQNVPGRLLRKLLEYCRFYNTDVVTGNKHAWNASYLARISDTHEMCMLSNAANYLNVPGLLELLVGAIAEDLKGKTVDEIREKLHVDVRLSPEDETRIRDEYGWAFES